MSLNSKELALEAAYAAMEKKAVDPVILDLAGLTVIADYFVICSGENTPQVKAITDFIEEALARKGVKPSRIEGLNHRHWVLIDYGDVIIHIFIKETREYYSLEKLWMDAATMEINENKVNMDRKDKGTVHP